jgi:sulfatase maturation enzyme AslB (radical SAM superfamily)
MQVNKDTFCVLPFVHAVLNPYDSEKHKTNALPCCRYTHSATEHFESVDPINKSPTWIKLQEQFLNEEKPEGCSHCWRDEAHKVRSYRQLMLNDFTNEIKSDTFLEKKLLFLELMFGNTCNLACRSCGSSFSSKWVAIDKHLEKHDIKVSNSTPNIAFTNWRDLDLSHLTQLKIMGGEPFYQKGALELLEHLSDIGVLKNIYLSIPTNCTIMLNDRWKSLLLEARKVYIGLSIDAPGKLNDYIREGSDWETIERNIYSFHDFVKENNRKMHITFNTVVSVYNVNKLPEIERYFKKRFLWKHYTDIAYYPSYLDIALLPDRIKNNVIETGAPQRIVTYIKSKEYSENDFNTLRKVTNAIDKYNDKHLKDYNPQMYDWIMND